MVQMPKGVAVATQAIGEAGAFNAGLLACQILALRDEALTTRMIEWRQNQTDSIPENV
jgi:5-(carboxyamino)imidazole ribonucleotide mutase